MLTSMKTLVLSLGLLGCLTFGGLEYLSAAVATPTPTSGWVVYYGPGWHHGGYYHHYYYGYHPGYYYYHPYHYYWY